MKTQPRYWQTGEGNVKQLRDVAPPLLRLRTQDHRIFFREQGDFLLIIRVLNRRDAYR